jgi:hypothetical protein
LILLEGFMKYNVEIVSDDINTNFHDVKFRCSILSELLEWLQYW